VATIGKFDGIHCGHQQIIEAVVARAQAMNDESVVILFEPDPQEYFAGDAAPARLTRFREKWQQLERLGVDKVVCLRFGKKLALMDAEQFIDDVLIRRLRVEHLIVGDDFRFGRDRKGDFTMLKSRGAGYFTVQATRSICQGTERISSTLIREKLAQDKLDDVRMLLGRNYSISGRVAHGEKVGRTLGFPTLNIPLKRRVSPVKGVYLVQVTGISDQPLFGVANVGNRPTVNKVEARLEVHLLDFNGECYGKQVTVWFLQKLRNEQKFESKEQLKHQIAQDITQAKQLIAH
jgi:riboflavin kinase/FMN adenylyltransferase